MSKTVKVVVDLGVIPKNWSLEDFNRIIDETGLVVVDTQYYPNDDMGVKIIDEDNLELITIEEYEQRQQQ